MSKAEPRSAGWRTGSYMTALGHAGVTPRQWRRVRHKYNRAAGSYFGHWGEGCKGRPTPRQRQAAQ